jgi:hypothetical protein
VRQPEFIGDPFGLDAFGRYGSIGRTPSDGEIIAGNYDRPAIDVSRPKNKIRRHKRLQFAILVVLSAPGQFADFVECIPIYNGIKAFPYGQLTEFVLPCHLLFSAHLMG